MIFCFMFQYGDYVEKYLVQTRDIEDIMKTAKSGRLASFILICFCSSLKYDIISGLAVVSFKLTFCLFILIT